MAHLAPEGQVGGWGEEGGVDVAPRVCMWTEGRAMQGEGPSGGDSGNGSWSFRGSGHKGCALGRGEEEARPACVIEDRAARCVASDRFKTGGERGAWSAQLVESTLGLGAVSLSPTGHTACFKKKKRMVRVVV